MKAYRFRLAGVAHIRQAQEQAAANSLALANLALRRAESAREHAIAERNNLRLPEGTVSVDAFSWLQDQAERATEEVARRTHVVLEARAAVDDARRQWVEARQRTAVLERLDDRQRALWQQEFDRSEATEMDDMASMRFVRQGAAR